MLKKLFNFLFGVKETPKRERVKVDYRPHLQKLAEEQGLRYPDINTHHILIRNQKFLDGEEAESTYEDNKVMKEYAKLLPTVEKIQKKRKEAVEKLVAKRTYNASPGHSFNNNTSTHYVDNTPSIVQAAVLYSVLQDSSEPSTSRVDSYSSDCTRISNDTYASSAPDSYSSSDSGSYSSGGCD